MNIAKNADQLLKLMHDHEVAISSLYNSYARKFPEYKDFWRKLSEEEVEHAKNIDLLWQKIKEGSEMIVVNRFPIEAIETSMKYIKKLIDRVEDADFSLINAFSLAMHLEEALIENNYFEVFSGDGPTSIRTLNYLSTETKKHQKKIQDALRQYKQAGG